MPAPPKTDRRAILEAAVRRVRGGGGGALSLRALAADLGVAPNALYHYFPDRDHLLAALSNEVAARLHTALTRGARAGSASQRLLAMAEAYLRFARKEPEIYDLLLGPSGCEGEDRGAHQALWTAVLATVAEVHGTADAPLAATSLWALLHGAVALERAGVLGETKPKESIAYGLRAWLGEAARSAE